MQYPMVPEDWAAEAFTKGLNLESLFALFKRKEILTKLEATTWTDVHTRY